MIVLSRYKFVAKMLSGKDRVLEVGCGDAFGTRIVQQEVKSVCAIDFDPVFVAEVNERMDEQWRFDCMVHDMLSGPVPGGFDAAYSLDVIEHIPAGDEDRFLKNIVKSLTGVGVCILGTPSLESQVYASAGSKAGHINCKNAVQLRALMGKFFHEVFIFSMNDEVVHTGFHPMAHYLFALAVAIRDAG
jgi:2-polyprenyl-3-methyl-5-hydroxy-6-metoxy-1,4-benzoquinol methylase